MTTENIITPKTPADLNYDLVKLIMSFHREIKWQLGEYADNTAYGVMELEEFTLRSMNLPIKSVFLDSKLSVFLRTTGDYPINMIALDVWELSDLYERVYAKNKSLSL